MSDYPQGERPDGPEGSEGSGDHYGETDRRVPRQAGPSRAPAAPGEGVRIVTAEEVAEAQRRREQPAGRTGPRPAPPTGAQPAASFPLHGDARPEDVERPRLKPLQPVDPPTQPVLSVEPAAPEAELPHWTEPPTGEVPRVVAGDDAADDERWAARSSGPRWRDERERWDDEDLMADLAPDQGEDVGALGADRPRVSPQTTFDDLDVPSAPSGSTSPAGGVPADPAGPADLDPPSVVGSASGPAGTPRRGIRGFGRPSSGGSGGGMAQTGPRGGGGDRNMPQAIAVGVGIAAVALILAWLGAPWLLILVEVVVVVAAFEYLTALRRAGLEPPMLLGLVAVAALPLASYARGDAAIAMVLFLLLVFSMVWFLVAAGPGRPVRDIGTMLLAVVHVGVLGAFAALILRIGAIDGASVDQGVSILVLAVVAGVFYDVGGLFTGRRFGRTPLTAASPNKTREGLLGGLAVSVVAVLIAAFFPLFGLTTFSFLQALVFAVACAIAAFLGDLSESLIKRDLGLKDMGDLLPGHGGVLDRFDGMLFVLPTAY